MAASDIPNLAASKITSGTFDAARLPAATSSALGAVKTSTGITNSSGTISVAYGTTAGTACQGNDTRLSDSRTPKSHTHGNITNDGTITSTAVTSATGLLVYDSNNKIQRATAANVRTIIGAGTSSLALGTTSSTAAKGNHTHSISLVNPQTEPSTFVNLSHGSYYTLTAGGESVSFVMPTDNNTWRGIQNNLTSDSTTDSLSAAQGKALKGLIDGKAASGHTHTLSLAGYDSTPSVSLSAGTAYKLTAGGNEITFLTPSDTTYSSKLAASGGTAVSLVTTGEKYIWNNKASTSVATTSANGLMSSTDKSKLDGIASGANNYSLPLAASGTRGGVQIGYSDSGANVAVKLSSEKAYVALTKTAVTSALGYTPPTTNTTYNAATTSSAGLMSATDKAKLDGIASSANNYSLPSQYSDTITASNVIKVSKLYAPTTAGGSTYGLGTNGQILKTNGDTAYWTTPLYAGSSSAGGPANKVANSLTISGVSELCEFDGSKATSITITPANIGAIGSITATAGANIGSVGTPSVTASTSGTATTLTFNYLKGAKGDKGDKGDTGSNGTNGSNGTSAQ